MPRMTMQGCKARNSLEWVARMIVLNDEGDPASDLLGQRVTEHFGPNRVYRGMMRDDDLTAERRDSHRGSAAYAVNRMDKGREGRFEIKYDGSFLDFHGGAGLPEAAVQTWFTPEALRRGIGWTFIQTYKLDGTRIGRFHVSRIITAGNPYRLRVIKRSV